MNKAIDTVWRAEVRELKPRGRPAWLTKTRWLLLRRRGNRTTTDRGRLRDLVRLNLKAVRSMLLREDFDPFWRYRSAHWAGLFLDRWCTRVMRSRIDPMKKVARSLRTHRALLLNWCTARGQISTGAVEGQTHHQKGLWLSDISMSRNRPVPHAGSLAGARSHPQILLRNHIFYPKRSVETVERAANDDSVRPAVTSHPTLRVA